MKCEYKRDDGGECRAHAVKGSKLCFFHNPSNDDERKLAQVTGGKGNRISVKFPLEPMKLKSAQDVVELLEDTVNRVRSGEIDVKIGNCIGVLSGQIIKAIEVVTVSNRVEIIERAILERTTRIN
jgi:hypothetical protein